MMTHLPHPHPFAIHLYSFLALYSLLLFPLLIISVLGLC